MYKRGRIKRLFVKRGHKEDGRKGKRKEEGEMKRAGKKREGRREMSGE